MSKNEYYLAITLVVSKRSTCMKRHNGAGIFNNDEIVSIRYNGNPRDKENYCDRRDCQRMNLRQIPELQRLLFSSCLAEFDD